MKTKPLKQELQEVYFANGNHLDVGSVMAVLKDWLTQKRQFYSKTLPRGLATTRGIMIFDELLEETEK